FFFSLLIALPLSSTLLPYTTLFRSALMLSAARPDYPAQMTIDSQQFPKKKQALTMLILARFQQSTKHPGTFLMLSLMLYIVLHLSDEGHIYLQAQRYLLF